MKSLTQRIKKWIRLKEKIKNKKKIGRNRDDTR